MNRGVLVALAAMGLCSCVSPPPQTATAGRDTIEEVQVAQPAKQKKRLAPPNVSPVVYQGIRYEALQWGKERGLEQNGGYVIGYNVDTDQEVRLLKVYTVSYDRGLEGDKLDLFIKNIYLETDNNRLIVEDERGRRFRVDLDTQKVEIIRTTE